MIMALPKIHKISVQAHHGFRRFIVVVFVCSSWILSHKKVSNQQFFCCSQYNEESIFRTNTPMFSSFDCGHFRCCIGNFMAFQAIDFANQVWHSTTWPIAIWNNDVSTNKSSKPRPSPSLYLALHCGHFRICIVNFGALEGIVPSILLPLAPATSLHQLTFH